MAAVSATAGGKPLVIDFTATWCPPCKRIGPIYEAQVANFPELTLKKLDIDANPQGKEAAGVSKFPTFKVYKNGVEVDMMEGATEESLLDMLNRAKAP